MKLTSWVTDCTNLTDEAACEHAGPCIWGHGECHLISDVCVSWTVGDVVCDECIAGWEPSGAGCAACSLWTFSVDGKACIVCGENCNECSMTGGCVSCMGNRVASEGVCVCSAGWAGPLCSWDATGPKDTVVVIVFEEPDINMTEVVEEIAAALNMGVEEVNVEAVEDADGRIVGVKVTLTETLGNELVRIVNEGMIRRVVFAHVEASRTSGSSGLSGASFVIPISLLGSALLSRIPVL